METLDLLKELGMDAAYKATNAKLEKFRKLNTAYANYEFVPQDAVDSFNVKLREKTEVIYDKKTKEIRKKIDRSKMNEVVYDKLVFRSIKEYGQVPPTEALLELKKARDLNCFDSFEVAKIESVVEVIDPIIFGKIAGCSDLFMITQWDNDIKFDDLRKEVKNVNIG